MARSIAAPVLELAAASTNLEASRETAANLGGTLYCDERNDWRGLPFRALVTAVTDNPEALEAIADVGLYVICRRLIKEGKCGVAGLFPMVHNPKLSHREADAHWRDQHGPLALRHHAHMSHYTQLSVVHRVAGAEYDGFAICGFNTLEDLRQRFYTTETLEESRKAIAEDVVKFADTKNSPRRLIVTESQFGG